MLRRLAGRWLVLLLGMLVVAGCGTAQVRLHSGGPARLTTQPASLMLDWVPNSDHGGIYTAIQQGIFRRHGIAATVRVPSANTAQIQLVAAGKVDFGVTYETDLLNARAQHIPVQSVMCIMQHPLNTVMALKSSHIARPRDLVGKMVGMAGSPSDKPIVSAMMAADHRSINQARMVNVGYSLLPALLSHKVDAVVGVYWTWEAIQARQKGYPVNVMRVERWGVPNYCELVLIANEKTVRERPAFVRDVVQSLQRGYAEAEAHPKQAWQALHAADKTLDRPLVLQSLTMLRPAITGARTIGFQEPEQWSHYASWLNANKLLTARVDVSKAFTNRFLDAGIR
jgi:putative hydroxymethylpyrimidine transport system substrate-binding protein